ncbi:EamA family transporter [Patescibacteria group bacterium]|nr:EamA family transporter [Patescibacteria group bacterium]MBU1034811.1 EamA family transporter [Patescibacteria group bacterium]MBU1629475.1 EamA family transporter [Patescibacteria group bacterium]MBU1907758.1 EamA family transporter [Patescibacteria group bacterium]
MPSWFFIAIAGHLSNAAAFIIDKTLLSTAFKRSATYAGLVGLLSLLVIFVIPWINIWPRGATLFWAIISGATFVFALWAFFEALRKAEASRVVPIIGSLIPIFTLAGTAAFLAERLSAGQFAGFALLVAATAILSGGGKNGGISRITIAVAILSAILFAISSVSGKSVYMEVGFLSGFTATRLSAALTALVILMFFDRKAANELRGMVQSKAKDKAGSGKRAAGLAILGQSLGAIGFFFVQLGIAKGSAAIVNALQAVQYAVLVIAAFALRKRFPKLLNERFDREIIITKIFALLIAALGMALVV